MKKRAPWLGLALATVLLTPACGDEKKTKKDDSSEEKDEKDDKSEKSSKKADGSAKPSTSGSSAAAPADPPSSGTVEGAAAHLPSDCEVAGRVDFSKLLAMPQFKKDIIPLIDELLATPAPKDEEFKKVQAFLKENNLDYKTALKDLVFCVKNLAGEPTFAVAVGGSFKPETLVDAIDKQRTTKKAPVIDIDGRKAFSDEKFTFGQLADGTVVLAEKVEMFKAMNATGDSATRLYKLDMSKLLSAATSDDALTKAFAAKPPKKGAELFALMKTLRMTTDLDSNKTSVVIGCKSADDATKLNAYITVAKSELEKNPAKSPFPNSDKLLKNTKISLSGSDVIIDIVQPQAETDAAFKYLADELRKAKGQNLRAP